jgi:hypothetical protein
LIRFAQVNTDLSSSRFQFAIQAVNTKAPAAIDVTAGVLADVSACDNGNHKAVDAAVSAAAAAVGSSPAVCDVPVDKQATAAAVAPVLANEVHTKSIVKHGEDCATTPTPTLEQVTCTQSNHGALASVVSNILHTTWHHMCIAKSCACSSVCVASTHLHAAVY